MHGISTEITLQQKTSLQMTEQYDVLKLFVFGYECDFFQGRHIWLHN